MNAPLYRLFEAKRSGGWIAPKYPEEFVGPVTFTGKFAVADIKFVMPNVGQAFGADKVGLAEL